MRILMVSFLIFLYGTFAQAKEEITKEQCSEIIQANNNLIANRFSYEINAIEDIGVTTINKNVLLTYSDGLSKVHSWKNSEENHSIGEDILSLFILKINDLQCNNLFINENEVILEIKADGKHVLE